jgi:CubicO group peptidase (beta-lactamase class C family)
MTPAKLILSACLLGLAGCSAVEKPPAVGAAAPAAAIAPSPPPITPAPADRRTEYADALFSTFTSERPGLAVLVTQDGKPVYERYFGMADLEHSVRVTELSRFHVASVSKQFTAYAAALLAAEGKLDLDADIRSYLPDMPDFGKPVTTRMLLNHTSGIRDQWALFILAGYDFQDFLKQSAALSFARNQRELNFEPGSTYEYSNGGYSVAATVVEKVSGKSLRRFLEERVFGPLGMTDTFVYDDAGEIVRNRAMSYTAGATPRLSRLNYNNYGATSLHSTPRDLAKWAQELIEPRLLNASAIAMLKQRGKLNDGTQLTYALGVGLNPSAGRPAVSHGGSDAGYRAQFSVFPEDRASVVVLSNGTADTGMLAERLAGIFLANGTGDMSPGDASPPPPADKLALLVGHYAPEHGPGLELRLQDDVLMAYNAGIPAQLSFRKDGRFYIGNPPGNPPNWIRLAPDGIALLRGRGEGTVETLRRFVPVTPAAADLRPLVGAYHSDEADITYRMAFDGSTLRLSSVRTAPISLTAMDKDRFAAPAMFGSVLRIVRNRAGKPTGFRISMMGGRLRNVLFERVE